MKHIYVALLGMLILTGAFQTSVAAPPANGQSSPAARAVLEFISGLESRPDDKRILSGQFSEAGSAANLRLLDSVHSVTGHWPAILGTDYADFGTRGLSFRRPNDAAIAWWKAGGLVTISAHLPNPANLRGGGLRDTGVDLADLLRPETATHTRWMQQLDTLADGLTELRDAGVVVLWRPFHEMNGGWFWWGGKDPEAFHRLWQQMFDYFSNTRGLNNLLWVYSPNHGPRTADYYPGDGSVDIVGLDAYTDDIDRQHIQGYAAVAALPKPFGFTEYGPHGARNPPGDYDYRRLLQGLRQEFPRTAFFMSWNGKWSLASNRYTKELLDAPAIANRDDLPAALFQPPNHPAVPGTPDVFQLSLTDPDRALEPKLRGWIEVGRRRVETFFGQPYKERVKVIVFPNRQALDAALPREWGLEKTEPWMVAMGVADRLFLLSPRVWKSEAQEHDPDDVQHVQDIVTHELVHVFHGQHNRTRDFTGADEIGWFIEGLAVHVSGQLEHGHLAAPEEAVAKGAAPTQLATAWSGRYRYGVCGSLVQYVDVTMGRKKILQLLGATNQKELMAMLEISESQLLERWKAFVQEKKRSPR